MEQIWETVIQDNAYSHPADDVWNFENETQLTVVDLVGNAIFGIVFNPDDLFSGRKIEPAVHMDMGAGSYIVKIKQGNQVIHHRIIIH